MILFFVLFSLAQEPEPAVCKPPSEIKDRVNEYCIQASQLATNYPKNKIRKIKNGQLFFTSVEGENGFITLKMTHQCRGQKISAWKKFEKFCGYEVVEFDRQTSAIKKIRANIALKNRLNEKNHRAQIDRLVAQQMNPWIADPLKNIIEKDGNVKIKTLKNIHGITCHTPEELTYETNCK